VKGIKLGIVLCTSKVVMSSFAPNALSWRIFATVYVKKMGKMTLDGILIVKYVKSPIRSFNSVCNILRI